MVLVLKLHTIGLTHSALQFLGTRKVLMGKITGKILERASRLRIPVMAFTGQAEDIPALKEAGFQDIFPLSPAGILPSEEDLKPANARKKLQQTAVKHLSGKGISIKGWQFCLF